MRSKETIAIHHGKQRTKIVFPNQYSIQRTNNPAIFLLMKQNAVINKTKKPGNILVIIIATIISFLFKDYNNHIYVELTDKNGNPVEYYIEIAHEPTENFLGYTCLNVYDTRKIKHKDFIYKIKETDRMNLYIDKQKFPFLLYLKGEVNGYSFDYKKELKTSDVIIKPATSQSYDENDPETEFRYCIHWNKKLTVERYIVYNLQGAIYSRNMRILPHQKKIKPSST